MKWDSRIISSPQFFTCLFTTDIIFLVFFCLSKFSSQFSLSSSSVCWLNQAILPYISLFPFSLLHCFSVYLLIYFSISQMTAKFYHAGYKKRFPKFSTRFFVFLSTQILLKSLLHILGQFSFPISGKNIKKRKFFDFFRRFAKVTLFCNGLVICHK